MSTRSLEKVTKSGEGLVKLDTIEAVAAWEFTGLRTMIHVLEHRIPANYETADWRLTFSVDDIEESAFARLMEMEGNLNCQAALSIEGETCLPTNYVREVLVETDQALVVVWVSNHFE